MTVYDLFETVKQEVWMMVQAHAPYAKGDLMRSFRWVIHDDGFSIETDIEHMQYTEEKWAFNSRWDKTLNNPNEGWYIETAQLIAERMARRIGGDVRVI